MADWRDVMEARREASDALGSVRAYGGRIEDSSDPEATALAMLLAADAICLELRALGMVVDYGLGESSRPAG